jgi:phosphoglycolate phosphatase
MKYRAALFDLDGTLLDTLDDLGDSMNAVLASHGFPTHPIEAYKTFVGDGVRVLVERCLPEGKVADEPLVVGCVKGMREEYGRRWNAKTRLYPGIAEMLDGLTARGIGISILSNKPHPAVQNIMGHYFARWKFTAAFGEQSAFPKKPDPAAALEICRLAGIAPRDFLYLGDTDTDMKTALAAGMRAVGVLWGFRPETELRGAGAQEIIRKPQELLALV